MNDGEASGEASPLLLNARKYWAPNYFFKKMDPFALRRRRRSMTKKDKIAFIKSSKRKTHVYSDLARYTDQQLNDVIREIVHGLVRESEIIANAYINGYR